MKKILLGLTLGLVLALSPLAANAGAMSPSEQARSWQGQGDYPGIDAYQDITLLPGQLLVRGEPNGTEYFSDFHAFILAAEDAENFFEGLQVKKHPQYGYRSAVQLFMVQKENILAAYSLTEANPQFGKGGSSQYFIPDAQTLIEAGVLVPIRKFALHNYK